MKPFDLVLRVAAAVLMASLVVAAWHDASQAWDVWSYHLPFAARIAGAIDANAYTFSAANQARFEGFPLLAEALQGVLFRLTRRPECANFVALAALPALALFLRRVARVPLHLTIFALLAIPLVQIHATSSYVDLPANACATMLLFLAFRALVAADPPRVRTLVAAALLAAMAANMKFQLVPIVVAGAGTMIVRSLKGDSERTERLLVVAGALPFVFATPLKNLALHHNPVWPIELHVVGVSFPHVERAYASSPAWLEHSTKIVRFACSVGEIGLRSITSHARWSLDQWTPSDDPGYRMGGFFGAYVLVNVAALVAAPFVVRSRESKIAGLFYAGITLVTAFLPQSHELRYYMFWMMLLVSLNLATWSPVAPRIVGIVGAAALAIVAWSTGGSYLYPSGDSFADLVATKVDRKKVVGLAPGAQVCVAAEPWTFLYASAFQGGGANYSVREAESEADCTESAPRAK